MTSSGWRSAVSSGILCLALVSIGTARSAAQASDLHTPISKSFYDPFDRIDSRRWMISDGWVNGAQQGCTWSHEAVSSSKGLLHIRILRSANKLRGYKCGEIRTYAALGYGTYEARMRIAGGSGMNSAIFTYSGQPLTPIHDEIDFEFLGKNTAGVQLNYFAKSQGGHESIVAIPGDATNAFHDYAFVWAPGTIRWYIDGRLVRTETGDRLPNTPGQFFLTLWSGSSAINAWLGSLDDGRLPATVDVDWAAFTASGDHCLFPTSITCSRH